jgi:hypothetical protein
MPGMKALESAPIQRRAEAAAGENQTGLSRSR